MSKIESLFNLLLDLKEKTSLEIQEHIYTVATGSMVGDLRKAGCDVECRFIRKTSLGAMVYGYTLLSFPKGYYGVGV